MNRGNEECPIPEIREHAVWMDSEINESEEEFANGGGIEQSEYRKALQRTLIRMAHKKDKGARIG